MKFLKIFLNLIIFWVFYIILAWHWLVIWVLAVEFICPYIYNWSGCAISQSWDRVGDFYFIISAILIMWVYAGFVIHWNYKEQKMSELQKVITMFFFWIVTYPFLYLAWNSLYEKFLFNWVDTFTHTFLIGTFFSILVWILLVIIYFFIQTNNRLKEEFEKNNIKK